MPYNLPDRPVFEYYDETENTNVNNANVIKLLQKLYVFCSVVKTDDIVMKNLANNKEYFIKVDIKQIRKHLNRCHLIN